MCHPPHQGLAFLITGGGAEIWFDYDETDTLMLIRAALSGHILSDIRFSIALHRPESRTIKVRQSSKCLTKQSPALTCSSPSKVRFMFWVIYSNVDFEMFFLDGATLKSVNAPAENLAGKKDMALVGSLNWIIQLNIINQYLLFLARHLKLWQE